MKRSHFRLATTALLAVVSLIIATTARPLWAAEEEEEIALEPIGDYPRVLTLLDRPTMTDIIGRLSSYQTRLTGYPDAGLVLAPDPMPALDDFMRFARRGHASVDAAAERIWPFRERGSKRLPSNTELEEKLHGMKRGDRQMHRGIIEVVEALAVVQDGLAQYRRLHPPASIASYRTAQQHLVVQVLRTSLDTVDEAYRRATQAVEAAQKLRSGDGVGHKREVVREAESAVLKLDHYLNVPGDRFDSLPGYVDSFKALAPAELQQLQAAGKLGAAGLIYKRFRELGLADVDIEPFPVVVPIATGARTDAALDATLIVGNQSFTVYPLWPNLVRTPQTSPNGVFGRLIYAHQGSLREYNGLSVSDSVVLLDLNSGPDWYNAPMLGARAVLFIEPPDTLRGEMENKFLSIPVDLPRFWVPKGVADHLLALIKSQPRVIVTVKCNMTWETRPGYNIVGRIRGTDERLRKQQVVLQSYFDSTCIAPSHAPGAENAVSIAALLEIAKTFVAMPPKRTLLFVASSGHFQGLAGAKQFIARRTRGARTDRDVRRLFSLAYDSRKELDEASDRVWEKEKKKSRHRRQKEKEKTPEEKVEEQIKALGRIDKACKAIDKNLKKYRKTLRKAREENPNKHRPEDKLFSDEELADRMHLLTDVFAPRIDGEAAKGVPGIAPALAGLRAALRDAEPLAKHGAVGERRDALDVVKAKVEALGDALDFSDQDITAWFSIDLSSHNDTFGIFYKAYFYNYAENIQWKFSDIGKKSREYGELVAKEMAINLGDAMVDGINAIQGKTWSVYMGGKLALDSEVATLAGIPGIGFATIDDSRYVVDTPFDVIDRVNVDNVFRQTRFLACLLHDMVSISDPKDLYRLDLQDNFCEVYGHLVEFDPRTSYFPDRPIPGSIAVARANTKTAMGVRCEVMSQVGDDGKLSLLGLPNARAFGGKRRIEGYHLDPQDGHVDYAPDLGRGGAETYPIEIPMDMMEKPVTVVMFECLGMTIFDMIDQRFFTLLSEMYVYDAASEAQPQEYGYCLPLRPQQWVSYYEPVAVVYARPGTRLKVTMGASVLGLRFVLLNSERDPHIGWNLLSKAERDRRVAAGEKWDQHVATGPNSCRPLAEGTGYLVDDYPRVAYTPYMAAVDMWIIDDHRADVLAQKGIENENVMRHHNRAREFLEAARGLLERKQYDEFMVNARSAWSFESRAYPDIRKTETDVVKGIIFYLALLLPFSYFAERLVIAAREIRRQIAGWFGTFIVIFILIALVHPAFAITFTPAIIFLAFVILTLTGLVVAIIVGKFEEQMKQVKYEQTGVHTADVGRLSASSAAFSLGISNMRRRKTRTALTCTTLILLTFTVLSFTSVKQGVRQNRIRLQKEPPYNGLLIRDKTWAPLGEPTARILTTEFGARYPVAPRAWYFAAQVGQQSFLRVYRGVEDYYDATAMVGLAPEEAQVTHPETRLEWGRWFEPGDSKVCIIPKGMAEKLNIGRAEVGDAEVTAFGVPLRVIGVINPSKFKRLVDLDGEQLTPVDYLLMQEQQQRQQESALSEDELREYIHLAPDQVLFVPYRFAMDAGANLRSVVIAFKTVREVDRNLNNLMRRVELNIYAGRKGTGVSETLLCSAVGTTGVQNLQDIAIPVAIAALIVLNTMLGSVYERTREIGIYSSLGLAPVHIASLFIAEACVYAVFGAIAGYLVGQVIAKLVVMTQVPMLQALNLNYSSLSAVGTTVVVMAVVLLSTLYPAKRASQIAVPGIERRWKLPDPVDDAIDMTLPFTVTGDQALGVNAYLYEYLEAHADYSLGHFSTGDIKLQEYHSERGTGYELNLMVWLAPYDLGVSERLHLQTRPSEDEEVFEIGCVIERESGDESSWIRVTRNFINMLRKQYLLWRTFRTDIKGQYEQRGREMLAATVEQAGGSE